MTVIAVYAIALLLGIVLRILYPDPSSLAYATYKDMMPLIIAIPAAYLASCFQQRNNYALSLRALWSHLIAAVSAAVVYTHVPAPSQELYTETLRKLGIVVEEVRGVFKNIPRKGYPNGWYPFEPIKQIYNEIRELGYGDSVTKDARRQARERISDLWRRNREQFLAEFDRDVPTFHYTEQELASVSSTHSTERPSEAHWGQGNGAKSATDETHLQDHSVGF